MVGGTVVQIIGHHVEVLEVPQSFSRQWRWLADPSEVREGDQLWWQAHRGYLSRKGVFVDKCIGECVASDNPKARSK